MGIRQPDDFDIEEQIDQWQYDDELEEADSGAEDYAEYGDDPEDDYDEYDDYDDCGPED